MTKVENLGKRLDSLEPKPACPKPTSTRKMLYDGLLGLAEDDQICLAYLIRDLYKENINPDDFEAWLSRRPKNQQALARKILSASKEEKTN